MSGQGLIQFILERIIETPTWVWFVFVYLLFTGIKNIKTRDVYMPQLLILPLILIGITLYSNVSVLSWATYTIVLGITTFLFFKFPVGQKFEVAEGRLRIKLFGTYSTLVILMSFFIVKYFYGYMYAHNNDLYQKLAIFEVIISGIFSGYFLGKALCYYKTISKLI